MATDTEAPEVKVRDTAERDTPALFATSPKLTAMMADLSGICFKTLKHGGVWTKEFVFATGCKFSEFMFR